jgi:cytochrome c oxidase cbb3-type subunit I
VQAPPLSSEVQPGAPAAPTAIDLSCRVPLLVLFLSAAIWLLLGSVCTLLCSLKFHSPSFLADAAWLTYGRLLAAGRVAFLYGGCVQAGLGLGLWMLARLGRSPLRSEVLGSVGASLWNLGVTIAFIGILLGDSTGFEYLEMPAYSVLILFLGYLLLGLQAAAVFHQRQERSSFPSQWFILAALFWFPWIYSTAELLLLAFPVRGVAQAVIDWWYADNLLVVWFGLAGLATVFYFVPKLTGKVLQSQYLALFVFWMLLLFGSWGGVPNSAPVPAWMPTISTVARVLMILPLIAVALNVYGTTGSLLPGRPAALSFILFGVGAFILAGLMRAFGGLFDWDRELHFTWFATSRRFLQYYGFFTMVLSGAVYYVLPRLLGVEFPSLKLVRVHFWSAAVGVVLVAVPLAIAGVAETMLLQNPEVTFLSVAQSALAFLRASTLGDVFLVLSQGLFLANLAGLVVRFYRARAAVVYAAATADLYPRREVKT